MRVAQSLRDKIIQKKCSEEAAQRRMRPAVLGKRREASGPRGSRFCFLLSMEEKPR